MIVGTFALHGPGTLHRRGVADARSDIYALAAVLHECLTGRLPFSGGGVEGLAAAHRTNEPPKPSSISSTPPYPPGSTW